MDSIDLPIDSRACIIFSCLARSLELWIKYMNLWKLHFLSGTSSVGSKCIFSDDQTDPGGALNYMPIGHTGAVTLKMAGIGRTMHRSTPNTAPDSSAAHCRYRVDWRRSWLQKHSAPLPTAVALVTGISQQYRKGNQEFSSGAAVA